MKVERTYDGLRVLEVGANIAGPLAAMILGDLGADVVKVEHPVTGDDTRRLAPLARGESTVFRSFNRSKRSVALDLASAEGRAAMLRLAATADVVIENLRPGVAERLGVGFDDLRAVNDRLIYCSISAFGKGPIGRTMPGYDAIVQAFSGIMASTGHPGEDEAPVRVSASLADVSTGMWAALGVAAALARRAVTGSGQYVEACLLDSAFVLMAHQLNAYLALGEVPQRLGSASPSFAPYQAYRAADGWVFVAAGSDRLFAKLCQALGVPELSEDSRYATAAPRVAHLEVLNKELEPLLRRDSVRSWIDRLTTAGIPACPVNGLSEAIEAPVSQERSVLVGRDTDGIPWLRLPIDHERESPYRPAPKLGEHTRQVLVEAGFTDEEIDALRRETP